MQKKLDLEYFCKLLPLLFLLFSNSIILLSPSFYYYYHPDELMHIDISRGSTLLEVYERGLRELHPPGTHFIRYLVSRFDGSIFTQRLLSIIPSLVSVTLAYILGFKVSGRSGAFVMAGAQALSPFTVTYSFSIRNYALFLCSLYALTISFSSFMNGLTGWRVLTFIVLCLLSCSLHYSGFIYSFCMLGTWLIYEVIRERGGFVKKLLLITLFGLPLLALGIVFYFTHLGASSQGGAWVEYLFHESPSTVFRETTSLHGVLVRIEKALRNFYGFQISSVLLLAFVILVGITLGVVSYSSVLAYFSVVVLFVQLGLSLLGIYPFAGNRYNTFLFIPLTLGLSYFAGSCERLLPDDFKLLRRTILVVSCFVIVVHAVTSVYTNSYFRWNYETPLVLKNWDRFIQVLERLPPDQIILTNKIDALYLNSYFFPDATYYRNASLIVKEYAGNRVFFQSRKHRWNYEYLEDFKLFLRDLKEKYFTDSVLPRSVWFSAIGVTDFVINSLYDCAKEQGWLLADFSTEDFLFFKVSSDKILMSTAFESKSTLSCFDNSRFPHLAQLQRLYYRRE